MGECTALEVHLDPSPNRRVLGASTAAGAAAERRDAGIEFIAPGSLVLPPARHAGVDRGVDVGVALTGSCQPAAQP